MPKRILIIFLSALAGSILAFIFNYFFLEKILIPDPCYYHSHDTNKIFDLFYSLPASEGNHPLPTMFNLIGTLITGAIIGAGISFIRINRQKKPGMEEALK